MRRELLPRLTLYCKFQFHLAKMTLVSTTKKKKAREVKFNECLSQFVYIKFSTFLIFINS